MDKNGSCTFERQEEKAGTDPLYTMQPLHCAMKLAARVSAKQWREKYWWSGKIVARRFVLFSK